MNNTKRSFTTPKSLGKTNGKLKDILSSSRHKSEPKIDEIDLTNIPIIRQADNARLLPKYTSILAKTAEEGVAMDDLDQLQQDLEKLLLSTSGIRTRYFDAPNDRKAHDKTSLKRKRPEKKPKFKDLKNGMRVIKKACMSNKAYEHVYQEIPEVTLPRNDNSDKFWASIEPFCAPVNKDDVAFLDKLIQEFSKEYDIKIPDIGEHYANGWSEEIINDEQSFGKSPTKKNATIDIKKNGLHAMVETFSTPQTQRLLSALIPERVLKSANSHQKTENGIKVNKVKSSELSKLKQNAGQKVGTCLDRRLKKELVEQGILTIDDLAKNMPEDEILTEIKKCQQELSTVNEYNIEELNKLKSVVLNDIRCNELKEDLDKVDREILELYQEEDQQNSNEDEQFNNDFERKADALIKQQIVLNREINSLTDMSMLY